MKICSQQVSGCMFIVVVVQIITWVVVSGLLFYRGIYNVWNGFDLNVIQVNRTSLATDTSPMKGYSAGIVILFIASMMMIIGPIFLVAVIIEKCHRNRKFAKLAQDDLPPKYEDIVMEEMAPTYSSLFLNTEQEEQNHT